MKYIILQNVKHLNKHGDISGDSMDDILKANDCLSKTWCDTESKFVAVKSPVKKRDLDEAIYIDLDSKWTITHETVQVKSPQNTNSQTPNTEKKSSLEPESAEKETDKANCLPENIMTRSDWKTHKRERSDDSLPDPDSPMYNLLLLCKSAVREQKRIAVDNDISCSTNRDVKEEIGDPAEPKTGYSEKNFSVRKKVVCQEKLVEQAGCDTDPHIEEYRATFFLSVFHALTGLAALAFCHLQNKVVA